MNGKVYLLIGVFGMTIVPILEYIYERHLVVSSKNIWLYIAVHISLIFTNGSLNLAVFAFFDNARVDWQRRHYLMKLLHSTILADDGVKFRRPEIILTPLFNIFDQRSILSWYDIRTVFLTAGARFALRTEIYLGIFVIIDMILAIGFCIRLIMHDKTLSEDSCQALILIYVSIVTSFLFHTLFKGAYING